MAIPAILGAGLLETLEVIEQGADTALPVLAVGFVTAFFVGWGALALLIEAVKRGRLALFAWYLVPLGVAVVSWRVLG